MFELVTLEQYATYQLNRIVVIAGFIDHGDQAANFTENWKYLIQRIVWKFNPVVIPKTIAISYNSSIHGKLSS